MKRPALSLLWLVIALAGCARELMPTPNLYAGAADDPFAAVVPAYRTPDVDLLYATDRVADPRNGRLEYGYGRSPSLAYGSCVVGVGRDVTWEQLVHNSRVRHRDVALPLTIKSITEQGRFPETPPLDEESVKALRPVEEEFLGELSRRLAMTPRKEVFIFVHGYHDTFDDGAYVAAELWHFLGRQGVAVTYSWPAGHGGLLKGYDYDRESGIFTEHHCRKFIELVASCPDVKAVTIVAHSRGTSVVMNVLGDMMIAARASGRDPLKDYKLNNVVMAAADIDIMVATQLMGGEHLGSGIHRSTLYVSDTDEALDISGWLFGDRRLGAIRYKDLTDFERTLIARAIRSSFVDARVPKKGWGHSYFHTSPAVSSDLMLLLRDDRGPGADNGRPLTEIGPNYWDLDKDYPGGTDK